MAAVAIVRLPGRGGHIPYEGIEAGTAKLVELPGILLAALGGGLAVPAVRLARKDTPDQVMAVLSAAAAFGAIYAVYISRIWPCRQFDMKEPARSSPHAPAAAATCAIGRIA